MDALVEGLMEELNCETVFTIPLFGGIPVYELSLIHISCVDCGTPVRYHPLPVLLQG